MNIIFDLDGTLADCEHRRHLVTKDRKDPQWVEFYKRCVDDTPIFPIIRVFQELLGSQRFHLEIWSGRHQMVRHETEAWLTKHVFNGFLHMMRDEVPLLMRPDQSESDAALKQRWLNETKFPPNLVFDDRARTVAMWRRHGIQCAQVAPGDF